ncbi:hypothetical protein BJX99DRAFT_262134 [Aspergillus californicus]
MQFKKWGLGKKQTVPRTANWDFIAKRVDKRKRLQGKESEVVIDEETIPPENIRKLQYGRIFVSTADRFSGDGAEAMRTVDANLLEKLLYTTITKSGAQSGNNTILGAAAKSRRLENIKTILRVCPGLVNPKGLEAIGGADYLSPISAAISNDDTEALKTLLDAGVDIHLVNKHEEPPIERALDRHNLRAYEILVESDATITRPLSYKGLRVLMRFISGEEDCVSTMTQLIDESAQLSRNVTEWSGEVLAEAIKNNDLLVIGLFLDFGAIIDANKVICTRKETAQYLDTRGLYRLFSMEMIPNFCEQH